MNTKRYPTIGCCGIDCGLCPRHYTDGSSRCPGCTGEGFELVHPSCGFITCCVKKHNLEACGECGDFPCRKFDKETGEKDSFVTHRRVMQNQRLIADIGIDAFVAQQQGRIAFLNAAIGCYNDGKSKNLYCLAATLLSVECLDEALALAKDGENLRTVLTRFADAEGQELKLRK